VTRAIQRFSPRGLSPATWSRIEDLVRSSVVTATPTTVYDAQALMTVVTELVVWVDTLGLPLDPVVVFHPDTIDRFAREGCAHLAGGTQFNYRRQLRAVGAAVLGPEAYPPRALSLNRSDPVGPYTPKEVASLWSWCRGLPTERYRHNVAVVLAFGLGTGITAQQLSRLVGTDVSSDRAGVMVHVIGTRSRDVPVLRRWEHKVAVLAAEAGDGAIFLPERTGITRRQIPNFIARCPKGDAPALNMVRLRVTWIVGHLAAGTQIKALELASGVDASQLVKYARYVGAPDAERARQMLHDAEGP